MVRIGTQNVEGRKGKDLDFEKLVNTLGVNLGGVSFDNSENKVIYGSILMHDYGHIIKLKGFTYRTFDSVMDITDSTGSTGYVLVGAHIRDRENEEKMKMLRDIYLENGRVPIRSYTIFRGDGSSSHSGFYWQRKELIKERRDSSMGI